MTELDQQLIHDRFESAVLAGMEQSMCFQQLERLTQRAMIMVAMRECHGNQCHAAEKLGIHRNTLARMIAILGIGPVLPRRSRNRR